MALPEQMTGRERIIAALNREPTDVVPFDIGGTNVTSLNVRAHDNLKAHLGIDSPTSYGNYRSQRTQMSKSLSQVLGSDVRQVHVSYPAPLPEEVTKQVQVDEWGVEWQQAESRLYYVSSSPLGDATTTAELGTFDWPDPADLVSVQELAEAARALRQESDCAISLDLPNGIVHLTQYRRGFEQWLLDSIMDPSLFDALLERVTEIYVGTIKPLLTAVGDAIDLVTFCDDVAVQSGPLVDPRVYRGHIKPRHTRILEAIRESSSAPVIFHTCGSVVWVLPDLIDMGIDASTQSRCRPPTWIRDA